MASAGSKSKSSNAKSKPEILIRAAATGNLAAVVLLLGDWPRTLNINAVRTSMGSTPLTLAAAAGHKSVVELLLDHGADPNAPAGTSKGHKSALVCAAVHGNTEVVKLLLERGADPDSRLELGPSTCPGIGRTSSGGCCGSGSGADQRRAERRHVAKFTRNSDEHEECTRHSDSNTTPLMCASACGHRETVQLLLQHGAMIEARNKLGRTAFHAACMNAHPTIVEILIRAGCNTECDDTNGFTGRQLLSQKAKVWSRKPKSDDRQSHKAALSIIDRQIVGCPLTAAWQRLAWATAQHPVHGRASPVFKMLYQDVWELITTVLPDAPRKTVAARALMQAKFEWRKETDPWGRGAVGRRLVIRNSD